MKLTKQRRIFWIKSLAAILVLLGSIAFIYSRKEKLTGDFTRFLSMAISRQTDLTVTMGRIEGHVLGWVSIQSVEIKAPWLPEGHSTVFKAEEIVIRYRLLDFLSKKFDSTVELSVKNPELYWRPRLSLRKPDFPFMEWVKHFALSQDKHLEITVEDLKLFLGETGQVLGGIDIYYRDKDFKLELPLSHLTLGDADISSVLQFSGQLEVANSLDAGILRGKIVTEGSVVNWKPLPQESQFEFVFSSEGFSMTSSNFLGGIQVTGAINFSKDYELELLVRASNYPLSNLEPLFGFASSGAPQSRVDIDTRLYGNPWAANVESYTRIYDGLIGKRVFKAMDVHVEGIFPTLRLTDSRILLEDGSAMRIADKTLEVHELFKRKTYESLIAATDQEMVVWGDWELSRAMDSNNQPEFLVERVLGERTRLHLRKSVGNEDEMNYDPSDSRQVEVGFEYRLKSKDSLKLELREDEEFVGVERKLKF